MTVRDVSVANSAGTGPAESEAGQGGRHWTWARCGQVAARNWARFTSFSLIGAAVFALGIGLQVACVRLFGLSADVSYLVQGIVSIEASFLANYFWTWRDVDAGFWACGLKFNAQKVVLTGPNFAVYACFIWLGTNYVVANVAVTGVFTLINYVLGDRWVFIPVRKPG